MTDSSAVETREIVRTEITEVLRCYCEALPAPERQDEFASFFDRFADARIVLLGEATHGTSEFYRARAAITERLISHHGFAFVAVEADWPDAAIHRGNRTSFPEVSRPGFFAAGKEQPSSIAWRKADRPASARLSRTIRDASR